MSFNINDLHVSDNSLRLHTKDFRGENEIVDIMEMNPQDLYHFIITVYKMGHKDARRRIQDALSGSGPDYTRL